MERTILYKNVNLYPINLYYTYELHIQNFKSNLRFLRGAMI